MPGYAVILDKVAGLSDVAKSNIRRFVADRKMGIHNNPRPFSTQEFAEQGIVSSPAMNCLQYIRIIL